MASKKGTRRRRSPAIVVNRPQVAGVDIGSREHWVCGPASVDGAANVRVFGCTTPQLNELVDWLESQKVESVAMESTSVYWIPLFELLEARGIEAVLVDARQMHNVPGRKTDMNDCQWIQLLHSCGLLRASFRPSAAICKLRALQRQLSNLVVEKAKFVQWMQKALDQMNVLVHRAVSDVTGKTGMGIVRAIVAGERDPKKLAKLRDPRCRKSPKEIIAFLTGTWHEEHIFNLGSALQMYDMIDGQIRGYEARILQEFEALQPPERRDAPVPSHPSATKERAIAKRGEQPLRATLWRVAGTDLTRIDGLGAPAARTILTEIGLDLTRFPTEKHFVSWLRLSPRSPISGGKPIRKRKNGLGATRVANVLRMAAAALSRSKSALGAAYRRVARRKTGAVAVKATARKLAQLVYRVLRYGHTYVDLGEARYEARFHEQRLKGLKSTAQAMGYELVLSG